MKFIRKKNAGFTLLEIIISCAVLGIVIAVVVESFIAIKGINHKTKNLTIATQVIQQQIETYRNMPYNSIPVGTKDISNQLFVYPSLSSPKSASIKITEVVVDGLKQIDVSIIYTENSVTKNVQTSTLITPRGINR